MNDITFDMAIAEQEENTKAKRYGSMDGYDIKQDALETFDDLCRLDLVAHALELNIKGLTVIPPSKFAPPAFTSRLLDAVLGAFERRHGERLDYINAESLPLALNSPLGVHMPFLIREDPVFLEYLANDTVFSMMRYMLGRNVVVSAFDALIKANGGSELNLHTDEWYVPPPFAVHAGGCNVTCALTDYTIENGALTYVPGSHKHKRHPVGFEGAESAVPVEASAGSLIIWDGATWHGALPRRARGLRINLVNYFARPHMRTLEGFQGCFTDHELTAMPDRLSSLLGAKIGWGNREEPNDLSTPDARLFGVSAFR